MTAGRPTVVDPSAAGTMTVDDEEDAAATSNDRSHGGRGLEPCFGFHLCMSAVVPPMPPAASAQSPTRPWSNPNHTTYGCCGASRTHFLNKSAPPACRRGGPTGTSQELAKRPVAS
eukprot:GHVU01071584.1.p3 GENE.GHVU01071584.1~~GHVU01071584.1.p3  ORF type:complete len:116 (+),score=9.44 GHVU01071584.1:274-621(+)